MDNMINNDALVINSKAAFIENVQRWVVLDKKLKLVNEKTRELRNMKHTSGDAICEYMKKTSSATNKINITNGHLQIYEKNEYSPLTFGYIEQTLSKIISNPEQVDYIMKHLRDGRELKTTTSVRGTYGSGEP